MTKLRNAIASPRSALAGATPFRARGTNPTYVLYSPSLLSMWGNYNFGDCCTAEECFAKACYNPEVYIPQHKAVVWARKNGFLNGTTLIDVLQRMQHNGFDQDGKTYNDGSYTSVDWTNGSLFQNAISQGPVKLGVAAQQLENSVLSDNDVTGWFGTGYSQDDNLDHCISACGYGTFAQLAAGLKVAVPEGLNPSTEGYAIFTWNSIGVLDHPSLIAITGEAWLRTPTTVIVND